MNTDNAAVIPLLLDPSHMRTELRKAEQELSASTARMADKASVGTSKLGNVFGRGSEFTVLTKTLMGGGAIMGLGLFTNAMERASEAALRMAESIREGKKSAAEIHAEVVSGLPVLGSLVDAGVNMAKAFGLVPFDEFGTGLRKLRAEIAAMTTGGGKTGLAKIADDFDKLREQLAAEFRKSLPSDAGYGLRSLLGMDPPDISRQQNQLLAAIKELEEKRSQAIAAQRAADEEKERKAREGTVLNLRGRIDALQVEADTYLMSAEALREYNLQRQLFSIADERERELIERATRASWEAKDAKDEEAEALERLTKAREESISAFERESEARQRAAERIREAGKTPLDRAREAIAEAQGLLRSGDIGLPDYQAFIARQREGLGGSGGGSWGGITSMSGALSALANAAATGRDRRAEEETARNTAEIKRLLDEAANKGKQLSEDGKAIIQAIKDRTLAGVIGVFR